jgi:CheY-like chemotaxis protein
MAEERRILNGWKEIAAHLGRGVRTVQRWELLYRMPVHRPAERDRSAVVAFSDELDQWVRQSSVRGTPYVRPTIIVLDVANEDTLSNRKLTLEIAKFNVLTAFTVQELLSTAAKFDADAFVIDTLLPDPDVMLVTEVLKQRFPRKPVVAVGADRSEVKVDRFVEVGRPEMLCTVMTELLGEPKIIPHEQAA